jgi:hypothetical protein
MKRIKLLLTGVMCIAAALTYAQNNSSQKSTTQASKPTTQTSKNTTQISDEDLRKYAITMDSVNGMQQTLLQIISENVQKNTVMEVTRYNELYKIEKDQAKLTAANAKPEEIAFLKEIADLREWNTKRINATYQALAKDYVGLKAFNAIRKSLETDPDLKAKYESISQQVQSQGNSTTPSDSKGK